MNLYQIVYPIQTGCKFLVILNLKKLNVRCVDHIYFEIETLRFAVDAMTPGYNFGLVALSDAYHSITIKVSDRQYFYSILIA